MPRHRNRNNFQNTIKDYFVPIIGGIIVLLLIISMLGGDDNIDTVLPQEENKTPVSIEFKSSDTQAEIEYAGNVKQSVNENSSLYKGETILVQDGILVLNFPNNNSVALNKVARFSYNEDASYSLYLSEAWLQLQEQTSITMKYGSVVADAGSIISLNQNEAGSSIYVLKGSAKITNIGGASTSLVANQKVSIPTQFASDSDYDLSSEKGNIDSYFKSSDWYIENQGHLVIAAPVVNSTDSTEDIIGEQGEFISFKNLRDEMSVDSSSIDITGNIVSDNVGIVTIDGKTIDISSDKSFVLTGVNVSQTINDLVIKIYDDSRAVLEKSVITVYNNSGNVASTSSNTTTSSVNTNTSAVSQPTVTNSQGVTTYEVDGTDFGFTLPSVTGKFSTSASQITIRGITTAEGISKVEVNGFELSSFNGSTWRYHAFEEFETLEEGTNQYKVDYYGENGNIVYTDYYTIVKKAEEVVSTPSEEVQESEDIISQEASTDS